LGVELCGVEVGGVAEPEPLQHVFVGIAAPFGFAANLANSQRTLLDTLFMGGGVRVRAALSANSKRQVSR
jgi:hypothetical protein